MSVLLNSSYQLFFVVCESTYEHIYPINFVSAPSPLASVPNMWSRMYGFDSATGHHPIQSKPSRKFGI
jgi:hypothetical protein